MNSASTASRPSEKSLDDQRGGSVPQVSRSGIRGYERAYSERDLRGELVGSRPSIGSCESEETREETVEEVRGELDISDSVKEGRRFSKSTWSLSDSE